MQLKLSRLKIISFGLGAAAMLVASELQKRETREIVEEVIAERDANQKSPTID